MTFPPDSAMALLLSLMLGEGVVVQDGQLALPDPTDANRLVLADANDLSALESREWIAIDAVGAFITERGLYWTRRYLTKRPEFRAVANVKELLATTR